MNEPTERQKSGPLESDKPPLSPALKSWLDNVIVPALVEQWLAAGPEVHGVDSGAKSNDVKSETAKLR